MNNSVLRIDCWRTMPDQVTLKYFPFNYNGTWYRNLIMPINGTFVLFELIQFMIWNWQSKISQMLFLSNWKICNSQQWQPYAYDWLKNQASVTGIISTFLKWLASFRFCAGLHSYRYIPLLRRNTFIHWSCEAQFPKFYHYIVHFSAL